MTLPPHHPGVTGTGDETDEELAAIKQAQMMGEGEESRVTTAWRETMRTVTGRTVVWDILMGHLRMWERVNTFGDPLAMSADLSIRNVGLNLWEELRRDYPAECRLMQQENEI